MKTNPILKLQQADDQQNWDVLHRILWQRGIRGEEETVRFLQPALADLHDPSMLKGMEESIRIVDLAIRSGKSICIYGDYDVDGMVSTSLLTRFFLDQGQKIRHYIPSRHEEGYGLNCDAIRSLAESGVELLITVDCGITSVDEVALAKSLGLQVVVTDHHQCPPILPEADVIVNPHQPGCAYPNKNLCGAGVAFKWIQGYTRARQISMDFERYLPFAALATVADVVKLTGENRTMVKLGIPLMENSPIPGFQALLRECEIQNGDLNSGHMGFQLAPRLNAVGRLENAELAIRLLVTDDLAEAEEAAGVLSGLNEERKRLEKEILEEAVLQVEALASEEMPKFLVVSGENWNEGVIGIVASRLVERYYRPTIVLAVGQEGIAKGSARSIPGLNMFEALSEQQDLLLRFGGHAQAAGLSLEVDNLPAFSARMNRFAQDHLENLDFQAEIALDYQIGPEDVDNGLIENLNQLAPFGYGNPRPVAYFPDVEIQSLRVIGKGREHLAGSIRNAVDQPIAFIGFHQADFTESLKSGERVDLAATLGLNKFRGRETIQLQAKTFYSLDQQLVEILDSSLEALVQHIFQFPNSLKYDKIMRLSTKPYLELKETDQRNLLLVDSLALWMEMRNEVRLLGRACQKQHQFCLREADADHKGWCYLFAPSQPFFTQDWDQIHKFQVESGDADFKWLPDVETLRSIYRWFQRLIPEGRVSILDLYRSFCDSKAFPLETTLIALWIFQDVCFFRREDKWLIRSRDVRKVDLEKHPLMQAIMKMKNETYH